MNESVRSEKTTVQDSGKPRTNLSTTEEVNKEKKL
jgi:hypothetical protein